MINIKQIEMIYLACPFRHEDKQIMRKRCAAVLYTAAQLSSNGKYVFSPLTHNGILVDLCQNVTGEHWMQFDLTILNVCQRLIVLKMEGWESSKGVQIEIAFASKKGIPIEEMIPPEESDYNCLIHSFQKLEIV